MYTGEDENNTDVFPLIASFVASGFGFGSGLEGATTGVFEDLLTGAAAVPSPADAEVPKAYLKYFVFSREMQMTQHGHVLLSEAALNNWEKLELEIPIQTNGYIYIYVANESMADVNVHFDDMEVILIESPAVNGADYYPFGLAMDGRSWSSEPYRFGYQGQFSEFDDETGWNAFELRNYDPIIGRWLTVDPYNQFASPYIGMGNNPVNGFDPDGGFFDDFIFNEKGNYLRTENIGDPNHRIIVENSISGERSVFSFNDSGYDFEAMNQLIATYGSTTPFLFIKSFADIENYMQLSGARSNGIMHAWQSKAGESLDFTVRYLLHESKDAGVSVDDIAFDRGGFFVVNGYDKAYNLMDFGNFLWGGSMRSIGLNRSDALLGAHFHHIIWGRSRHSQGGFFDSPADQRAISDGWYLSNIGVGHKLSK